MNRLRRALLEEAPICCDGGWGSSFLARGLAPGACPEVWNLERPEAVRAVAEAFVRAGARVIATNTFGANACRLAEFGRAAEVRAINHAAAAISRAAAGPEGIVCASIGPAAPPDAPSAERARAIDALREQAALLAETGVDAICIETQSSPGDAARAVWAAREQGAPFVACSFVFRRGPDGGFETLGGASAAEAIGAALDAGADAVGANCLLIPAEMHPLVEAIAAIAEGVPVLARPCAGQPVQRRGALRYPAGPAAFGPAAASLHRAGARLIGGCCGAGPGHIRALRRALDAESRAG